MTQPQSSDLEALRDVAERSIRYLGDVAERRVAPADDAVQSLVQFDVPLQDDPISAKELIEQLDRIGAPATMAVAGPRFFGFVNGSGLPAALAANWLMTAWHQTGSFFVLSPVGTT